MKVHELLTDESKWTQGAYSRLPNGEPTYFTDREATCWCLRGALLKCHMGKGELGRLHDRIEKEIGSNCIAIWNDAPGRTFQEVRDLVVALDI